MKNMCITFFYSDQTGWLAALVLTVTMLCLCLGNRDGIMLDLGVLWNFSPQEVLMTSRSSAYFHLLRSYFFTPAAALVACT